jgi:hypothetical protein
MDRSQPPSIRTPDQRIHLSPWPLVREYHQSLTDQAGDRLGPEAAAVAGEASRADPWVVVDQALAALGPAKPASLVVREAG